MSGSVLSGELEKLEAKPRVFKPDIVRHYHIDHNAPCPPPPPPPKKKKKKKKKKLYNYCFQFLLGITVIPREIEDNGCAKILGGK